MSRKVLVVDDEKLIVKGIRFSLEQDGMEVDCAYDGEEAVEKAKEKKYDIILLDLMLPKMDGLEVCQQIREFSNVPKKKKRQRPLRWETLRWTAKAAGYLLPAVRSTLQQRNSMFWSFWYLIPTRFTAVRTF